MVELAKAFELYGPWAVTAVLSLAAAKLYYDLRSVEKSRVEDLQAFITERHEDATENRDAWQAATRALESIEEMLHRKGGRS